MIVNAIAAGRSLLAGRTLLLMLLFSFYMCAANATDTTHVQEAKISMKATRLVDRHGLEYIGCEIPRAQIAPYLAELSQWLGPVAFERYRSNQAHRDHQRFHVTLINPYEYQELDVHHVALFSHCEFQHLGLGRASKDRDVSYFVVVESAAAQLYRRRLGLPDKDLHITLGFDKNDVFGVSKGRDALIRQ